MLVILGAAGLLLTMLPTPTTTSSSTTPPLVEDSGCSEHTVHARTSACAVAHPTFLTCINEGTPLCTCLEASAAMRECLGACWLGYLLPTICQPLATTRGDGGGSSTSSSTSSSTTATSSDASSGASSPAASPPAAAFVLSPPEPLPEPIPAPLNDTLAGLFLVTAAAGDSASLPVPAALAESFWRVPLPGTEEDLAAVPSVRAMMRSAACLPSTSRAQPRAGRMLAHLQIWRHLASQSAPPPDPSAPPTARLHLVLDDDMRPHPQLFDRLWPELYSLALPVDAAVVVLGGLSPAINTTWLQHSRYSAMGPANRLFDRVLPTGAMDIVALVDSHHRQPDCSWQARATVGAYMLTTAAAAALVEALAGLSEGIPFSLAASIATLNPQTYPIYLPSARLHGLLVDTPLPPDPVADTLAPDFAFRDPTPAPEGTCEDGACEAADTADTLHVFYIHPPAQETLPSSLAAFAAQTTRQPLLDPTSLDIAALKAREVLAASYTDLGDRTRLAADLAMLVVLEKVAALPPSQRGLVLRSDDIHGRSLLVEVEDRLAQLDHPTNAQPFDVLSLRAGMIDSDASQAPARLGPLLYPCLWSANPPGDLSGLVFTPSAARTLLDALVPLAASPLNTSAVALRAVCARPELVLR